MPRRFLTRHLVLTLLSLWVLGTASFLAWRDTLTTDEGIHVASGYLALTRGEYRFDPEHPFLFKELSALPLLLLPLNTPAQDTELWERAQPTLYDSWREARAWADQWFYRSGNPTTTMVFLSRIPAILSLFGLCWWVYFLGRRWFSEKAGLYAFFFTAFNPTLLAHGHLANTDVPVTLTFLLLLYTLWRYVRMPGWSSSAAVGGSLALALVTKHSALSFLPVVLIIYLYAAFNRRTTWRRDLLQQAGVLFLTLAVAWAGIWLAYGFRSPVHFNNQPLQWPMTRFATYFDHELAETQGLRGWLVAPIRGKNLEELTEVARWVLPIDYTKGVVLVLTSATLGRPSYLLGYSFPSGVWYYFPVLFFLKTQFIALFILAWGLGQTWQRRFAGWRQPPAIILGTATLVYGLFSVTNKLNLGIRHISPLLPLLSLSLAVILLSLLPMGKLLWPRFPRLLPGMVVLLYMLPVLWQFPHLLGFHNLFVQPPAAAWRYYNDSNLEWGQQGWDIAAVYRREFAGRKIYSNFPWSPHTLSYVGVPTQPFDPLQPPADGVILLTGTQLTKAEYAGFRSLDPAVDIGHHTFFYRLSAGDAVRY
jgi:hypothetical protein